MLLALSVLILALGIVLYSFVMVLIGFFIEALVYVSAASKKAAINTIKNHKFQENLKKEILRQSKRRNKK